MQTLAPQLWPNLLPELEDKIISFLDPNEVACSVRLVSKSAAARFSGPGHTRVRLSQPAPPPAFAHRWDAPGAMRSLTLAKRRELLCLTARSGNLANLQLLAPLVGCTLEAGRGEHNVLSAAAKAGHLHLCEWLRQQGCSWDEPVMPSAGWRLAVPPGGREADGVLEGAAEGFGPATLASMRAALSGEGEGEADGSLAGGLSARGNAVGPHARALRAPDAAAGPVPAWRLKLAALGARAAPDVAADRHISVADGPDGVERLAGREARGRPLDRGRWAAVEGAARRGDLAGLESLSPLQPEEQRLASRPLARGGHLQALRALHAGGWALDPHLAEAAAHAGHLQVVAWAVEVLGEKVLTKDLFDRAAASGNAQLLAWLQGRGCPCDPDRCWSCAADSGCEEVMEWLAANGCPLQSQDQWRSDYLTGIAACAGDISTLACLRRLGCVWSEDGATFKDAVSRGAPLPALRWLVEQGCPVDWGAALRAARWRTDAEVLDWVLKRGVA